MNTEILSSIQPNQKSELRRNVMDLLKNGIDLPKQVVFQTNNNNILTLNEFDLRQKSNTNSLHPLEQIKKKLKLNEQINTIKNVDKVYNFDFLTDLKYEPKYFRENSSQINLNQEKIKKYLIDQYIQTQKKENEAKQQMQRNTNLWFQKHQVKKSQEIEAKQLQIQAKKSNKIEMTIKQNLEEGIQVSGTIVTKLGYKITYPNLEYIIKATDIPKPTGQVRKQIMPLNQVDKDLENDLHNYVWKIKQYKQFFKFLLRFTQGNVEISEMLVKVQEKMRTSFWHVMTFYHISNRGWGISRLIKDLNKKGLFNREKQSKYEEITSNVNEDLDEIFKPFLSNQDWVSNDEQFISFEQYRQRLHEILMIRSN